MNVHYRSEIRNTRVYTVDGSQSMEVVDSGGGGVRDVANCSAVGSRGNRDKESCRYQVFLLVGTSDTFFVDNDSRVRVIQLRGRVASVAAAVLRLLL